MVGEEALGRLVHVLTAAQVMPVALTLIEATLTDFGKKPWR